MVKNREEIVANLESRFIILTGDGKELNISDELLDSDIFKKYPELNAIVSAELLKNQQSEEPPSIKAMRNLELIDYEPASDRGHFRQYPKGALVFDLIRLWSEEIALKRLEAYQIETPLIYDWSEKDIRAQAESFHERHYRVLVPDNPDKEFILRFAGDFGLFRMMKDAQLTYKHLPVRMYEFAPSFRYEKSGELVGLKRLRAFWMPDIHSFCTDLEQGLQEYKELYNRYTDLANGTEIKYAVAFRVVESFYNEHKKDIVEMILYSGKPAFIELLSDMKHYWVMKHEINSVDYHGGVCQVSTVQLDIKDASIYGITYVDKDGLDKGCTIVHSSIGSPERWIYSILEDALKKEIPVLPLWLAPIQVRIVPVKKNHLDYCIRLAQQMKDDGIRVDVDDRNNPLGWKIRAAEREWIPYILVLGDKEVEDGKLSVRIRSPSDQKEMNKNILVNEIKKKTEGFPYKSLPGMLVSKRPVFRGRD